MKSLTGSFLLDFKGPHVYVWRRGNQLLYIGSSLFPLMRITYNHHRIRLLPTDTVEFVKCEDKKEMLELETRLIKQHSPIYNRVSRARAEMPVASALHTGVPTGPKRTTRPKQATI